jgi:hypothetical protein
MIRFLSSDQRSSRWISVEDRRRWLLPSQVFVVRMKRVFDQENREFVRKPVFTSSLGLICKGALPRFLVRQTGRILMGTMIVGAFMILIHLVPDVNHPAFEQEPPIDVQSRGVVRSEVRRIWLPRTLIELMQRHSQSRLPETHTELCQVLKHEKLENVWYALTMRAHHAGGGLSDLTVVRRPYSESLYFAELLAVLATTAGHPPTFRDSDFSQATVQVLSDEISNRAPQEAMAELLDQRRPTDNQ